MAAPPLAPGALVWAKAPGFSFWPAVVIDANDARGASRTAHKPGYVPVRFLGTYDDAWVPAATNARSFAIAPPSAPAGDPRPDPSKGKRFQTAVDEAQTYRDTGALPPRFLDPQLQQPSPPQRRRHADGAGDAPATKRRSIKARAAEAKAVAARWGERDAAWHERHRFRLRVMRQLGLAAPEDSLLIDPAAD